MIRLFLISIIVLFQTAHCLAAVTLISDSLSYKLRTRAGAQEIEIVAPVVPVALCADVDTLSSYSSDFCWSEGMGDPADSAWALLFGLQQTCVTMSGGNQVRSIMSFANITGGVIFPGCDLGNPLDYEADAHVVGRFVIEVTGAPVDYVFTYDIVAEDWGGEILGGFTSLSGFVRISSPGKSVLIEDTLFAGVTITGNESTGSLQPGVYEISYEINHSHSGVEVLPWFPNGHTEMAIELDLSASLCGDVNANGQVDVTDSVYLINYIFAGGPPPQDSGGGDVNCNNQTDVTDAVYLINYIFAGGSAPCAECN